MSKKTNAAKLAARKKVKPRRGAQRRGRRNPAAAFPLVPGTPDRTVNGILHIFAGLIELGIIPLDKLTLPEKIVAPEDISECLPS